MSSTIQSNVDAPEARMEIEVGRGDYVDTIGFAVSAGELEVEEARDPLGTA